MARLASRSRGVRAAGTELPKMYLNLGGRPVNLVEHFQTRRGIICGVTEVNDSILFEEVTPLRRLQLDYGHKLDFFACVVPKESEPVRACARLANAGADFIFLSDANKKVYNKIGALTDNGTCRSFFVIVGPKAVMEVLFYDELTEERYEVIRATLDSFPVVKKSHAPVPPAAAESPTTATAKTPVIHTVGDISPKMKSSASSVVPREIFNSHPGQSTPPNDSVEERLSDSENTPRTLALIKRRNTTILSTKWSTALIESSARRLVSIYSAPHEMVSVGYSFKEVAFEYLQPAPVPAILCRIGTAIEVTSEDGTFFGGVYNRGGNYRGVNFHIHSSAIHMFNDNGSGAAGGGVRPLELFIIHELAGGKGEKTPLAYVVTFDVGVEGTRPNPTLEALLTCGCDALSSVKHKVEIDFALTSLIAPSNEKLCRYHGSLKILEQDVIWVVRQSSILIPPSQKDAVMRLLGVPAAPKNETMSSSISYQQSASHHYSGSRSFSLAAADELYSLSFAPLKHRSPEAFSGLEAPLEKLIFIRECGNLGFRMFHEALTSAIADKKDTKLLLVLLDAFSQRTQSQLRELSTLVTVAVEAGSESSRARLTSQLLDLETVAKRGEFNPVRRSLLDPILDLESDDWRSPLMFEWLVKAAATSSSTDCVPLSGSVGPGILPTSDEASGEDDELIPPVKPTTASSANRRRRGTQDSAMCDNDEHSEMSTSSSQKLKANTERNSTLSLDSEDEPRRQCRPSALRQSSAKPKSNLKRRSSNDPVMRRQSIDAASVASDGSICKRPVKSSLRQAPAKKKTGRDDRRCVATSAGRRVEEADDDDDDNDDLFDEFGDLESVERTRKPARKTNFADSSEDNASEAMIWNESSRKQDRASRIQKRRPTAMPNPGKRAAMAAALLSMSTTSEKGMNDDYDDDDYDDDDDEITEASSAREDAPPPPPPVVVRRRPERQSSAQSTHSVRSFKGVKTRTSMSRGPVSVMKKHIAVSRSMESDGGSVMSEDIATIRPPPPTSSLSYSPPKPRRTTTTSSKLKRPAGGGGGGGRRNARISSAKVFIDDNDVDDHWEQSDRKEIRFGRINNRRPTAHPSSVGKKAKQARQQMQLDSNGSDDYDDDDDDDDEGDNGTSGRVRLVLPGDENGEEKKRQKFQRLKLRRPTGYPGAKKVVRALAASIQIPDDHHDDDDDDDDDDDEGGCGFRPAPRRPSRGGESESREGSSSSSSFESGGGGDNKPRRVRYDTARPEMEHDADRYQRIKSRKKTGYVKGVVSVA